VGLVPLGQFASGAGIAGKPANAVGAVGDDGIRHRPLGVRVEGVAPEQRPRSAAVGPFRRHWSSLAGSQWQPTQPDHGTGSCSSPCIRQHRPFDAGISDPALNLSQPCDRRAESGPVSRPAGYRGLDLFVEGGVGDGRHHVVGAVLDGVARECRGCVEAERWWGSSLQWETQSTARDGDQKPQGSSEPPPPPEPEAPDPSIAEARGRSEHVNRRA